MKLYDNLITKIAAFVLICGVVLLAGAPPVSANVNIPDANLRKAINSELGGNRAANAAITEAEMETLTSLEARNASISNLTGLGEATNLTTLDLQSNSLSNISALSGLTNLTTLDLKGNSLSNISALSGLTNLTTLNLEANSLSNISALSGLTNLTTLNLESNGLSNLSALSGLTNLTTLNLKFNRPSSISALSGLTNLTTLDLENNSLTDISALSGLTNLTTLNLKFNRISSISALSGLTNLTTLSLESNSLSSDISALSRLTNLTTLYLGDNALSSISALSGLTSLTTLYLGRNALSSLSDLSGLTSLTTLSLGNNPLSSLSDLSGLTNLTTLNLRNSISDISPLVSNTGLATGDTVNLESNLLSYPSIYTHIPALETRGVTVLFDNRVPTTLTKVSGNARTMTGVNLLVVEVKDNASPAKGFEGVSVTFAVTGGGGTLSATNVATGATGQAQVTLTPGTGSNAVTATVTHAGQTLSVSFTSEAGVTIPDANLRRAINKGLGANRAADAAIAGTEMKTLTSLEASSEQISNLTGLEEATNLTTLDLVSNSISDISALSGLTSLTTLSLGNNALSSLSDLSGLTNLTTLDLEGNSISDISPLVSNTGLATGDSVTLSNNLLSYPSIFTHIPVLKTRGVTVLFDGRTPHSDALTKVSGDAQNGAIDTALANPFVVEVKDSASTTFEGVPVTFAVTAGGGTLSAPSVATDPTGRAATTLTLGSATGTNTVTATVIHTGRWSTRTFSVSFTANASGLSPTFTSAATFSVQENTTAVGTVVATDADASDSVTGYTLSGADSAKFAITNAGVLTFAAAPNYEAPGDLVSTDPANAAGNNEYVIVVTATSGTGARQLTAPQTLTITVTDVNEAPGQPAIPTVTPVAATPTSLSVTWTASTNAGPAITAYNLRYRKSSEVSWTSSTYAGTALSTTLTGLAAGTSYEVQVLAKNIEGDSPWSDSGTGATAYQPEDIDSDGDVDMDDLVSVINNFGSATPGRNDVDNDNDVDAVDIRAVFNAMLAAEAAAAPSHVARTAETLQDYVQRAKQDGMLDVNRQRGLAVLEELLEPFLIPEETVLLRNYPNPFNPETWFPYQLSSAADVTFAIYSVNGTLVRRLSLGHQSAGVYRSKGRAVYWDGRNALGESVASGIYFYTFTAGEFIATGKMLIRK